MKHVILISEHYYSSKRKAGFHFIADEFWKKGWSVIFVTNYVSWLSFLRGERRFPKEILKRILAEGNQLVQIRERFYSYVWLTPWHPFNPAKLGIGPIDPLLRILFKYYGNLPLGILQKYLADTSLFIFESTPGIMLFKRFKQINPAARYVYRISDDLKLLGRHPIVLETEQEIAPCFDLVSVPSEYFLKKFSNQTQVQLHYHGIDKQLFDQCTNSVYSSGPINSIFIGNSLLDVDFLDRASRLFPDITFHVIGPFGNIPQRQNIIRYGELPFRQTIPFIKFADIGLHTLIYIRGAESFTDSLKVHQYTYCQLPIIAPNFLKTSRPHMFYYQPGDDNSIREAFVLALQYDRTTINKNSVLSWEQLAQELAGELW